MRVEDADKALVGSPNFTLQSAQLMAIELKMSRAIAPVCEKVEDDTSISVRGDHPAHFTMIALLRAKGSVVQPTPFVERQGEGLVHRFQVSLTSIGRFRVMLKH